MQAVSENNYPNAWGCSGANPGPYYLQFGVSGVYNTPQMTMNNFSIIVTTDKVLFNGDAGSFGGLISIFNPAGKLVFYNTISSGTNTWDLTTARGRKITRGTYIAVLTNKSGENGTGKMFTIVK